MRRYPGELVDNVGRTITAPVKQIVSSVSSGIESAGSQVQDVLDKPFQVVGIQSSPGRVIHQPLVALVRDVDIGIHCAVSGLETLGHGITSGLDKVPETFDPEHLSLLRKR